MKLKQNFTKSLFALARLMPGRKKLPILIYHRVLDEHDPFRSMEPDVDEFAMQMKVIRDNFETMQISSAARKLKSNALPKNALCITFDDGYRDNLLNAGKILQSNNLTATFFIATGYMNHGVMWNDKILDAFKYTEKTALNLTRFEQGEYIFHTIDERIKTARKIIKSIKYHEMEKREEIVAEILRQLAVKIDNQYMMTAEELIKLRDIGVEIGGHTRSHPILANLSDAAALQEITEGKAALEAILQTKITSFAYPNGRFMDDYSKRTVDLVKQAGFECAVTTNYGISDTASEEFELNRISCWQKNETALSLYLSKIYFK